MELPPWVLAICDFSCVRSSVLSCVTPMTARQILVVEDDSAIRRGVLDALKFAGYEVFEAATFADGCSSALQRTYDLLLLDLVLPGGSGLDILRSVRDVRPMQPVIILTARGAEEDRVRGLQLGADDYVVKPFSVRELMARVQAVLRRAPEAGDSDRASIELNGTVVDLARREVRFEDGTSCELSSRELDLLRYLTRNNDRAISRDELLQNVWGLDARGISTRTIDMHVTRLREKLRESPHEPQFLLTVRGKGYMFRRES